MNKKEVLSFANKLFGLQRSEDENIVLWVLFDLANGTDVDITKDCLISDVNKWRKNNGFKRIPDGVKWDYLFKSLINVGYIETEVHIVRLTLETILAYEKSLKGSTSKVMPVGEFINQYGKIAYDWMKENKFAGETYVQKDGISKLPVEFN